MEEILKELEAAAGLLEEIRVGAIADCRRKIAIMGALAKAHMFIDEKTDGKKASEDKKEDRKK